MPAELRDVFAHHPGQHVVVRHRRAGAELRRSYSVCPPPSTPEALRLVVKRSGPGGFGDHATTRLAAGARLELSPPTGTFALPEVPGAHHVLLAGGTGITPWPRWPSTPCAGTRPAASASCTRCAPPPTPCWPTNWPRSRTSSWTASPSCTY
ncbi:FAD-binding oxidoreductase [Streptomyces werraensis]|nr:FAD-binding oxidoreductase [Streptomyces werraensis]